MNKLQNSILALTEAIRSATRSFSGFDKTYRKSKGRKKSGKTRRGAKHIVNPTFLSRNVLPITPAEYRRRHMGVTHVRSDNHK